MQTEPQELENTENDTSEWAQLEAQALAADNNNLPPQLQTNEPEPTEEMTTAELLAPVIKISADCFAPNWKLTEEECETLGGAYGALLDKYLPDTGLNNFGAEIGAAVVTLAIFGARRGVPLTLEEKPKKEMKKPEQQTQQQKTGFSYGTVLEAKAVTNES